MLLLAHVGGEVIVSDSDGHTVGLPTNGGAGTDFINGVVTHTINPYILSVFINDFAGENETFYLDQPNGAGGLRQFGFANLTNVYYSSNFTATGGISYAATSQCWARPECHSRPQGSTPSPSLCRC